MARLARVVVPGVPHYVTQRGNHRQETFFCDDNYQAYLDLMAERCGKHKAEPWATTISKSAWKRSWAAS